MLVVRKISASITGTSALTFARTLTTGNNLSHNNGGGSMTRGLPNDDYFATIHHISNIVRRDIYLERTLNKMHISKIVNSELVYRVLRSCCNSGVESFRFFNWARTNHPNYEPTTVEFEELLKILAQNRNWETMWKVHDRICHGSMMNIRYGPRYHRNKGSENSFNVRFQFEKKVLEKPRITVWTWDRARRHVNFGLQKDVT